MTASQKIESLLNYLNINAKVFSEELGYERPQIIYDILKGKTRRISEDLTNKITSVYTEVNRVWLLTGEGEMLKSENDDTERAKRTPVYDAETTGGNTGLVSSSSENANLVGYVDSGSWFENKETAIIRHVGDSMVEYPNGCWLAVKKVLNPRLLVPGRNYVIETDEFRVTKRIQKGSEKGYIKLYSTNQERYEDGQLIHEPFEIHLSDVRRIFSVLGYVVNQSGEIKLMD